MQIDLSQLFITMPACYGKLDQGVNYTIQQVLDYIDELGDQISEMEAERELLQDEISDIKIRFPCITDLPLHMRSRG